MKFHFSQTFLVCFLLLALVVACRNSARRSGLGATASTETGSSQGSLQATQPSTLATLQFADPDYRVVSLGEDHAVFGKVTEYRTTNGTPFYVTNRYTLLKNALNYEENGEWRRQRRCH